jgi:hypothetical protein
MAATFYVGPSASGDSSGSDESNLMSYATWDGSDRSSDTCYFGADMTSTISEDLFWTPCLGYYAKYVNFYASNSIGFRFADYERVFQTANGDIGVVGPVDITEVVPNPTTAVINSETVDVHGGMGDTSLVARTDQGFHGAYAATTHYTESLNDSKDISAETPYTLAAGHSFIHTKGYTTDQGTTYEYVVSAAALHAFSEVPAELSFRPTYAGGTVTKTIYHAADVNLDMLADVAATANAPTKSWCEGASRVLWMNLIPLSTTARCTRPNGSRSAYGHDMTVDFGKCALWTNTDQTDADKLQTARNLIQCGIDLAGMMQTNATGQYMLTHDGGGQGGSILMFLYAGNLLSATEITSIADKAGNYVWSLSPTQTYWPADSVITQESQAHVIESGDVLTAPWPIQKQYYSAQGDGVSCNVTNGQTEVTGNSTSWLSIGSTYHKYFAIVSSDKAFGADNKASDPAAVAYSITSINSDTSLTLSTPYTGDTANGVKCLIAGAIIYGHGHIVAMYDDIYGSSEDAREYTAEDVGLPCWGNQWGHQSFYNPSGSWAGTGWYSGQITRWWCKYQPMFTGLSYCSLAAMMMGTEADWNETDHASAYLIDRMLIVNDLADLYPGDFVHQAFMHEMWDAYRDDYTPAPWTPKCHTPIPAHSATAIETSQVLSWYDGNGRAAGTSCNVYFGTDSTPDETELVESASTDYAYTPELAAGTTYYWRVDEVCTGGTYTGDVWSFTTEGEEPPAATKYIRIRSN